MSETHRFPTRIFGEDNDAAGIVYYANYLRILERGRSEPGRIAGIDQGALLDGEGVMYPLRRCEIGYLQPARLDDQIEVCTPIQKFGRTSMDMGLDIHRWYEHIAGAKARLACFGRSGRPQRLPAHIRAAPKEFVIPS